MSGAFIVDEGVPIPPRVNGGEGQSKTLYPFTRMKVGDSFFVYEADPYARAMRQNSILATARRSKSCAGLYFTTRQEGDGVRVWRIPPPAVEGESEGPPIHPSRTPLHPAPAISETNPGAGVSGLMVKPYAVTVTLWGGTLTETYIARSPGAARAKAWRNDAFADISFRDFMRVSSCRRAPAHERFGEQITVCNEPAFWVGCNRQYIQFVRPDSDVVLNSHPYDVEPPEARRGTPYYSPTPSNPSPAPSGASS